MSTTEDCLTDIIRLQLKKPKNWNWQLTTSRSSPHITLPTIQLFNSKGDLLVKTTDTPGAKRQSWHSSNFEKNGRKDLSLQRCRSDNFECKISGSNSHPSGKRRLQERQKSKTIQRCRSDSVATNPSSKYDVNFIGNKEQQNSKNNTENKSFGRPRSNTLSSNATVDFQTYLKTFLSEPGKEKINQNHRLKTSTRARSNTVSNTSNNKTCLEANDIVKINPNLNLKQSINPSENVESIQNRQNSDVLGKLNKIKLKCLKEDGESKWTKSKFDEFNDKMNFGDNGESRNGFYLRKSRSEMGQVKAMANVQPSSSNTHCFQGDQSKKPHHKRTTSDDLFKRRLKYSEESLKRAEQDGYRHFIVNEYEIIKQATDKSHSKEIDTKNNKIKKDNSIHDFKVNGKGQEKYVNGVELFRNKDINKEISDKENKKIGGCLLRTHSDRQGNKSNKDTKLKKPRFPINSDIKTNFVPKTAADNEKTNLEINTVGETDEDVTNKTDKNYELKNNVKDKNNIKKKKLLPEMCTAETVRCENKLSYYQITELKEKRYKLRESRAGILIISDDSFSSRHRRRCHGEETKSDSSSEEKDLKTKKQKTQPKSPEINDRLHFKGNISNGTETHERKIMENVENSTETPNGKGILRSLSHCSRENNLRHKKIHRSSSKESPDTKNTNHRRQLSDSSVANLKDLNSLLMKKYENSKENQLFASKSKVFPFDSLFYYENNNITVNKTGTLNQELQKHDNLKRTSRNSRHTSLKSENDKRRSLKSKTYCDTSEIMTPNSRQESLNSDICEVRSINSRQTSVKSDVSETNSFNSENSEPKCDYNQNYFVQEPLTTPGSEVCDFVPLSDAETCEIVGRENLGRRKNNRVMQTDESGDPNSSSDGENQRIKGHIIKSAKGSRGKVTNCDLLQLVRRLSSPKLVAAPPEDDDSVKQNETSKTEPKRVEERVGPESTEEEREPSSGALERHLKEDMGSNVSRHSNKGLSGRRSQSSGSICNGKSGNRQNGDGKGSGGSLPSFLDDQESIYNNNHSDEDKEGIGEDRIPPLGDGAPLHWKFSDTQTTLSCQDQGYGSERSPEEEYPPPLPDHNLEQCHHHLEPHTCYPFITPDSTFTVKLTKGSRGLGLSVTGGVDSVGSWPGLVRIKRLFPHQPASSCGLLNVGDLLLEANGVALTGLSNYEALEVLRTATNQVELRVCRPPPDVLHCVSPISEVPPPPPTRREPPNSLNLPPSCFGNTPEDNYYQGEFEMILTKIQGSLGFTLRKEDDSALGHYVRALVREPALTDGRIKEGDRIIAVNDVEISSMSHEQAVQFLRKSGDTVKLKLYRDIAQTPISALSPTETTPRALRQEAVDMLNDIAVRKLIPGQFSRSFSPNSSPKKLTRRLNHSSECPQEGGSQFVLQEEQFHEALLQPCPISFTDDDYNSLFSIEDDDRPSRPSSLELYNPNQTPVVARKPRFNFSLAHNAYELNNLDAEVLDAPNLTYNLGNEEQTADPQNDSYLREPASMPHLSNIDESNVQTFSYKNPTYQSAHVPSSSTSLLEPSTSHHAQHSSRASDGSCQSGRAINGGYQHQRPEGSFRTSRHSSESSYPPREKEGTHQFRDRVLSDSSYHQRHSEGSFPHHRIPQPCGTAENIQHSSRTTHSSGTSRCSSFQPLKPVESTVTTIDTAPKVDRQFPEGSGTMKRKSALKKSAETKTEAKSAPKEEPEILAIELNRGWNSRLGFSLQGAAGVTYVSAVHANSVAARDGRIKPGDVILKVNDECVENLTTNEIIDLLRIVRGPVCIVVKRNFQSKLEDCPK